MRKRLSEPHPRGILFNILKHQRDFSYPDTRRCHCERLVCLRNPEVTCYAAFGVLLKTVRFIKSVPAVRALPPGERLVLLRERWAPLFILGLAQEHITFDVMEFPAASILRNILLNGQEKAEDSPPTLTQVHTLKTFLNKVGSLDLSLKEYACLKGAILFNQDIPALKSSALIAGLQEEALGDLQMLLLSRLHPTHHLTLLELLSPDEALQAETQSLLTELFFRPIAGRPDLQKLLSEMIVNNVGL